MRLLSLGSRTLRTFSNFLCTFESGWLPPLRSSVSLVPETPETPFVARSENYGRVRQGGRLRMRVTWLVYPF